MILNSHVECLWGFMKPHEIHTAFDIWKCPQYPNIFNLMKWKRLEYLVFNNYICIMQNEYVLVVTHLDEDWEEVYSHSSWWGWGGSIESPILVRMGRKYRVIHPGKDREEVQAPILVRIGGSIESSIMVRMGRKYAVIHPGEDGEDV